jgi:hypothetical protein
MSILLCAYFLNQVICKSWKSPSYDESTAEKGRHLSRWREKDAGSSVMENVTNRGNACQTSMLAARQRRS